MTRWARSAEQRAQLILFPERLDDAAPPDHRVRILDELPGRLDWSRWESRDHLRRGQPAIHPRVLAGVLLYGWWVRSRSSRGLEDALRMRLDFRWLVHGHTVDHTTLSEFRRKHSAELKDLFIQICQRARELGLLSLERLGFDGTRVRANNRRSGTRTPEELRRERDESAAKFDALAAAADCAACPLRSRCIQGRATARQISREQHAAAVARHAAKMATSAAEEIYATRRHAGERPFAVIKQQFAMRQFLLRGLQRVRDEWRWAATAFNLSRLLTLLKTRAGPTTIILTRPP